MENLAVPEPTNNSTNIQKNDNQQHMTSQSHHTRISISQLMKSRLPRNIIEKAYVNSVES